MSTPQPAAEPVAAILLAAGSSRRFGTGNKLLAEVDGEALVRHCARALVESLAKPVIVVTGHEAARIERALAGLAVLIRRNAGHAEGLASSLRTGIAAVPAGAPGALLCLADTPGLSSDLIDRLIECFRACGGRKIVYPRRADGVPGHPVAWPRAFFAELSRITGDTGGRDLLQSNADRAHAMSVTAADRLEDIDTTADLARWQTSNTDESWCND